MSRTEGDREDRGKKHISIVLRNATAIQVVAVDMGSLTISSTDLFNFAFAGGRDNSQAVDDLESGRRSAASTINTPFSDVVSIR